MTHAKVTIVLFMLRAVALSLTLPADSTLDSPSGDHIYSTMTDIQDARSSGSLDDVRGDNSLLPNPVVEAEDEVPVYLGFATNRNNKGRRMWRTATADVPPLLATLPGRDRSGKVPERVESKRDDRRILDPPLSHLVVPARREEPPHLSHPVVPDLRELSPATRSWEPGGFPLNLVSTSSWPPREEDLAAPATLGSDHSAPHSSGVTASRTSRPPPPQRLSSPASGRSDAAADASYGSADSGGAITRERRATSASYPSEAAQDPDPSSPDDRINDLEFFWSWEAVLLVSLPGAWLAMVAVLCFLTRSAPGNRLLAKLCPSPGSKEPEAGHGIGFIDGSPGMRRRLTQSGEMLAVVSGVAKRYTEGEGDGAEEKDAEEETMGRGVEGGTEGFVGREDVAGLETQENAGEDVSDVWHLQGPQEGQQGALEEYQRVLRKLSLIQEEMSP